MSDNGFVRTKRLKLTTEEYKQWLSENRPDIELIGEYLGSHKKIMFMCSYSHTWTTTPAVIKQNKGCPHCDKKDSEYAEHKFKNWLVENESEYELIGKYMGTHHKTIFSCAENHQFYSTPNQIKNNISCPICSSRNTYSTVEYRNWLLLNRPDIELVGEYISARTKTLFKCSLDHIWEITPDNIKRGVGCPKCSGNFKLTSNDLDEWLMLNNPLITRVENYVNALTPIEFACNNGHIWKTTPNKIKGGGGCPVCFRISRRSSTNEFNIWLQENKSEIILIEQYIDSKTKILFKCNNCSHEWKAMPSHIKSGSGCPKCATHGFNFSKPGWVYIFKRDNYIKYGITNNLKQRIKEHSRNGIIEVAFSKLYECGQDALDWEKAIKEKYGGNYVSKDKCFNGWTETLPIELLDQIIKDSNGR